MCHKQKWLMVFFTWVKVVAHVLASAHAMACINWRRLHTHLQVLNEKLSPNLQIQITNFLFLLNISPVTVSKWNWCFKKNFIVPFYGWGSTAPRLEPLWGGSLLFTTKFPEIPGTHIQFHILAWSWTDISQCPPVVLSTPK